MITKKDWLSDGTGCLPPNFQSEVLCELSAICADCELWQDDATLDGYAEDGRAKQRNKDGCKITGAENKSPKNRPLAFPCYHLAWKRAKLLDWWERCGGRTMCRKKPTKLARWQRSEGFLFLSSQLREQMKLREQMRFLLIHLQLQGESELEESMPRKHLLSAVDPLLQ